MAATRVITAWFYFDMNDFDEGVLAPATWELARMLTSIFVAFDSLEIGSSEALRMAQLFLKTYASTLHKGKAISIEPRMPKVLCAPFWKTKPIAR